MSEVASLGTELCTGGQVRPTREDADEEGVLLSSPTMTWVGARMSQRTRRSESLTESDLRPWLPASLLSDRQGSSSSSAEHGDDSLFSFPPPTRTTRRPGRSSRGSLREGRCEPMEGCGRASADGRPVSRVPPLVPPAPIDAIPIGGVESSWQWEEYHRLRIPRSVLPASINRRDPPRRRTFGRHVQVHRLLGLDEAVAVRQVTTPPCLRYVRDGFFSWEETLAAAAPSPKEQKAARRRVRKEYARTHPDEPPLTRDMLHDIDDSLLEKKFDSLAAFADRSRVVSVGTGDAACEQGGRSIDAVLGSETVTGSSSSSTAAGTAQTHERRPTAHEEGVGLGVSRGRESSDAALSSSPPSNHTFGFRLREEKNPLNHRATVSNNARDGSGREGERVAENERTTNRGCWSLCKHQ